MVRLKNKINDNSSKLFKLIYTTRHEKNEIIRINTEKINEKFIDFKLKANNKDLKQNLPNYLSLALSNTHYYGNLSIRYVTFNFTFVAFFASILAIYISVIANFNINLWYIGLPLIFGFIIYFLYFLIMFIKKFDTISFRHKDFQHYSSIMHVRQYPQITDYHLDKFFDLIEKNEEDLLKANLKTLILQYMYQSNYHRVALKMRICLVFGSIDLSLSIVFSFIMLTLGADLFIVNRYFFLTAYALLILLMLIFALRRNSKSRLGVKKKNEVPSIILGITYKLLLKEVRKLRNNKHQTKSRCSKCKKYTYPLDIIRKTGMSSFKIIYQCRNCKKKYKKNYNEEVKNFPLNLKLNDLQKE